MVAFAWLYPDVSRILLAPVLRSLELLLLNSLILCNFHKQLIGHLQVAVEHLNLLAKLVLILYLIFHGILLRVHLDVTLHQATRRSLKHTAAFAAL